MDFASPPPPLPPRAPAYYPVYRPLSSHGEIRLLVLHPATSIDAPIVCSLEHVYLGARPKYEAVSYCWGTKGTGGDILLDGQPFGVYENAEAALRRLRLPSDSRCLWVDAICINQQDVYEKNVQVPLMRYIYEQAEQVLAWLGEVKDETLATVISTFRLGRNDFFNEMSFCLRVWTDSFKDTIMRKQRLFHSLWMSNMHDSMLVEEMRHGEVRELLSRPWWTRAWIVQEAVMAKKLLFVCGPETFDWDMIRVLIKASTNDWGLGETYNAQRCPEEAQLHMRFHTIDRLRKVWSQRKDDVSYADALFNFRNLYCTDPRDRIYAFLGLFQTITSAFIVPDYNTLPADIYIHVARMLIERTNSLDILNCTREWNGVQKTKRPTFAYSSLDQSKYHDIEAMVQREGVEKPSQGWALLPTGWERIVQGNSCYFYDHHSGTRLEHSPLKTLPPRSARHPTEYRFCPEGWAKTWDNLGRSVVWYSRRGWITDNQEPDNDSLTKAGLLTLPSWVPNWAMRTDFDPALLISSLDKGSALQYNACGGTFPTPQTSPDARELGLEGILFDDIVAMAQPWHPVADTVPLWRKDGDIRASWVTMATAPVCSCPYSGLEGGRMDAVLRTHLANWAENGVPSSEDLGLIKDWFNQDNLFQEGPDMSFLANMRTKTAISVYWKEIRGSVKAGFARDHPDWHNAYRACSERIHRVTSHRAMFVTRKGYIGLAPWNSKLGDWVCVLNGGKTPYLLRPLLSLPKFFLVGETYVHGIMNGEAIQHNIPPRTFYII